MPYVPSKKTDGKSQDRNIIDAAVEAWAQAAVLRIGKNFSLIREYSRSFMKVAKKLKDYSRRGGVAAGDGVVAGGDPETGVAAAIYGLGEGYGYEGAFLGELNYAITRFIQRVPQIKVQQGEWKDEIRYWLYAATVEALTLAADKTKDFEIGVGGVFVDIKDEYKRRVNTAYEAAQIVKSGDCYDTPYYTRLIEIRNTRGELIGYQEIMLKRGEKTVNEDVLSGHFLLKNGESDEEDSTV